MTVVTDEIVAYWAFSRGMQKGLSPSIACTIYARKLIAGLIGGASRTIEPRTGNILRICAGWELISCFIWEKLSSLRNHLASFSVWIESHRAF